MKKVLKKILWQMGTIIITLIPLCLWLGVRALLSPEGFWPELIITGLGFYFLGVIQLVLIVMGVMFSAAVIWSE